MTVGPAQKVLREVATTIAHTEEGEITLAWSTAHGHRVVEVVQPTSGEAVATGDEPVDYVAVGGIQPAQPAKKPEEQPKKSGSSPVARAFADSWRTLFPPKESR